MICSQCGSNVAESDRFCGVCGTRVSQSPQDNSSGQNTSGSSRTPRVRRSFGWKRLLIPGIVVGGALLLLVLGFSVWSVVSPNRERIELAPGVYSEVPEGRVLKQWDLLAGDELIPQEYAEASAYNELPDQTSMISYNESCTPTEAGVVDDDIQSFRGGYDRFLSVQGIVDQGQATVAGRDATWKLSYLSTASPWGWEEDAVAAEYPNYSSGFLLKLCIEELDIEISHSRTGNIVQLFEEASENPDNPPTEERNALVPEAREEVHREIGEQYSSDIEDVVQFVEDISTDERDGETDLATLPRSFADRDEILPNPFRGELADGGDSSYTVPETTSEEDIVDQARESAEDLEASEDRLYKQFGREYDEAAQNEDWEQTYSMLGETSQEEFTEEEWIEKQQAIRESEGASSPLESVTVERDEGVADGPVTVILGYEDGTEKEMRISLPMALEAGEEREPERYLTEDEVTYLNSVVVAGESTEDFSGPTNSGSTAPLDNDSIAEAEGAARDYYQAAEFEDWDYTYEYLDSETQSMFTEEEWAQKNQWYWDQSDTTYDILSVKMVSSSEEPLTEVAVRLIGEDGSSFVRTTYWVLEDGEWLHRFSQEEIDLFMPELSFEEFVEANGAAQ